MSLLQTTLQELEARRGKWPSIANATGVSYSWICKFARGRYPNPGINQVQALADYFEKHPLPAARDASV